MSFDLAKVQAELKAPKGQFNSFGKYKYRSCEDIVEAVKPLLNAQKAALVISDDVRLIGDRYYIEAIATILHAGAEVARAVAFAREPADKKGMDASQVTGAASSYARKYALNGLFAIDDTKDADSNEHASRQPEKKPAKREPYPDERFAENAGAWAAKIQSGDVTAFGLIAKISEKFKLSDEQIAQIRSFSSRDFMGDYDNEDWK